MRAAILGAGAIAHAHAEAVAAVPGSLITHVVDIDADRAAAFAEQHGVARHGTSAEEVIASGEVDVVHVCTPPQLHGEVAAAALRAGIHVVLEKPPVLSLAELDQLIDVEDTSTAQLTVIVQHRFGSGAVRLRGLIADGTLGRPLVAVCNTLWYRGAAYFAAPWRGRWDTEGGGPTMGHGIHQYDLMLSLLGPWAQVSAMAARQDRDTETEDLSTALVRFDNGALATVVNSVLSPREVSTVRIDLERATVEVEHLYGYTDADWRFTPAPGHEELASTWTRERHGRPSNHVGQVVETYAALEAGTPVPVTSRDARRTLELAAAIYKSAFTGRPVLAGEIGTDDPFAASMRGTGAPWAGADRVVVAR